MKFSELNKEQKQILFLAVGGVITFFAIMGNLVIGPARANAAEAREIIAEVEDKVDKGERILRRQALVTRDVTSFSSDILAVHQEHLPPRISPYIWAVENLSLLAEELELVISVQEHPTKRYVPVPERLEDLEVNSIPYWIPYTVDVEMNASFAKVKSFLDLLENEFPYASVSEMQIQASIEDPLRHEVSIMVEWPTFRFDDDLDRVVKTGLPQESEE
jgi:hypothetical protein